MTVAELIEELQYLLDDRPELANEQVYASYDYGDYGRTEALVKVESAVFTYTRETPYSATGLGVVRRSEEDDEAESEDPDWHPLDAYENCGKALVLGMQRYEEYVPAIGVNEANTRR